MPPDESSSGLVDEPCAQSHGGERPMVEPSQSQFGQAGIMGAPVSEPELDSWGHFVSEFALDASPSWLFRGQANFGWGLGTSLRRAFVGARIDDPEQRAHFENSSIGFFKDRARLHLPRQPQENDLLGWLALMQHYSAPTRLQDWTRSPFVAAFFAYRENLGCDCALWAIQAYFCRRAVTPGAIAWPWDHLGVFEAVYVDPDTGDEVATIPSLLTTNADRENEIIRDAIRRGAGWPVPTLPFNVDNRMAAQQAAFLLATNLEFPVDSLLDKAHWPEQASADSFADDLAKRAAEYPLQEPYQLIKKVRLPAAWREPALRSLSRMGITEDTMFPGVDGVGRATADQLRAGELAFRDALNTSV